MTKEQKLLEEWQERLGLQDWAIVLKCNCEFEDMPDEAIGNTTYSVAEKEGAIKIIDKSEYDENYFLVPYDFERILVHELLHCKFAIIDLEKDSYESKVLENARHQIIDDLAKALVMAKRGETKRKLNCEKVIVK